MLISRQTFTACTIISNFIIFRVKKLSPIIWFNAGTGKNERSFITSDVDTWRIYYCLKQSKEILRLGTDLISKVINRATSGISLFLSVLIHRIARYHPCLVPIPCLQAQYWFLTAQFLPLSITPFYFFFLLNFLSHCSPSITLSCFRFLFLSFITILLAFTHNIYPRVQSLQTHTHHIAPCPMLRSICLWLQLLLFGISTSPSSRFHGSAPEHWEGPRTENVQGFTMIIHVSISTYFNHHGCCPRMKTKTQKSLYWYKA